MAVTEQLYTQEDFKQAVSALLPPGQYWQYEQGDQFDGILEGLSAEFKTIHDETKINPLYQENNTNSGWKLADYQRILAEHEMAGTVYDNSSTPNLIYIDIAHSQAAGNLMQTLDDYRLPHTAFCFIYNNKSSLYVAVVHHNLQINHHIMRTV
jgi:hypothetical protein